MSAEHKLCISTPTYVRETYAMLCRELDRKQGMIDDLKQLADDNFGLGPEDCDLLNNTARDRDNLRAASTAIFALFSA